LFVDVTPASWPVTLERMREALFRPFQPLDLSEHLYQPVKSDQKWLLEHGDQMVAAVPDLWEDLRFALEPAGAPQRQLADLVRRVRARRH
jgi:hypothetical protein